MEKKTGITKYNFTSICIRRLLEVGTQNMISRMEGQLKNFIDFVSINANTNLRKMGKENFQWNINTYINTLKIYKPFISPELLTIIYNNDYDDIYDDILSENLHVSE